jgi:hypothetical protein
MSAAAGVIEEAEGLGGSARLTHPIRCRVSGGYTISKLQGFKGADSPESLLTCILQVRRVGFAVRASSGFRTITTCAECYGEVARK